MASESPIFRQAALDRLASPERLDERLAIPTYPRALLGAIAALLAAVGAFAAWWMLLP